MILIVTVYNKLVKVFSVRPHPSFPVPQSYSSLLLADTKSVRYDWLERPETTNEPKGQKGKKSIGNCFYFHAGSISVSLYLFERNC